MAEGAGAQEHSTICCRRKLLKIRVDSLLSDCVLIGPLHLEGQRHGGLVTVNIPARTPR